MTRPTAFALKKHHCSVAILCSVAHALNIGAVPENDKDRHDNAVNKQWLRVRQEPDAKVNRQSTRRRHRREPDEARHDQHPRPDKDHANDQLRAENDERTDIGPRALAAFEVV